MTKNGKIQNTKKYNDYNGNKYKAYTLLYVLYVFRAGIVYSAVQ